MRSYASAVAVSATTVVLAVGGCTASLGQKSIDKDSVAKEVSKQLSAKVGQTPDKVTCPRDLEAKMDATLVCTLTDKGRSYDATVTVTKVKDTGVEFNVKVADHPKP